MMIKLKITFISLFVLGLCSVLAVSCFPDLTSEPITIPGQDSDGDTGQGTDATQEISQGPVDEAEVFEKIEELISSIVTSPVVLSHSSGEEIFASGDKTLIFIKGKADAGNTIEVYVNGIEVFDDIKVDQEGSFEILNGVEIKEGENTIKLIAINENGNKSKPTEFDINLAVPAGVDYDIYDGNETLKILDEQYYVKESRPSIFISGNYAGTADIYLQVNETIMGETTTGEEGVFTFEQVSLEQGENQISIWAVTEDDYVTAPNTRTVTVYKDLDSPRPSTLSGYATDQGNSLNWTTSSEVNFESYKLVRVENPCLNPEYPENDVIATFEDMAANNYIDEDIEEGKSYYYTLWTLDRSGSVVSSNVLSIPEPKYSVTIEKLDEYADNSINRREWYYQYYELTNTGNVTLDIQPIMVWIKLEPEPTTDMLLNPLWEVHLWDPQLGEYYYSDEEIEETNISDYVNTDGTTEYSETVTYSTDGTTKTVTEVTTTRQTSSGEGKRVMTITTESIITTTDLTTGISTQETSVDESTSIVEPEKVGAVISQIEPGEKRTIALKIQNIYAKEGVSITAHFWFVPVDCAGYYFTDELVSTGDVMVYSSGR